MQVWELSKFKLKTNHYGHTGYINTVSVSPDGSLAASGGKDGITMLWDLNEGKHLYSLEAGDIVNALVFSPNRYWLCAATASCVKIFDLESKYVVLLNLRISGSHNSTDRSLTSSSPTLLMSASSRVSLSACPLLGLQMVRPFSVASRTTWCASGPYHRERHTRRSTVGQSIDHVILCLYHLHANAKICPCGSQDCCTVH